MTDLPVPRQRPWAGTGASKATRARHEIARPGIDLAVFAMRGLASCPAFFPLVALGRRSTNVNGRLLVIESAITTNAPELELPFVTTLSHPAVVIFQQQQFRGVQSAMHAFPGSGPKASTG